MATTQTELKHNTAIWFAKFSTMTFCVLLVFSLAMFGGAVSSSKLILFLFLIPVHLLVTALIYFASLRPDLMSARRGRFLYTNIVVGAFVVAAALILITFGSVYDNARVPLPMGLFPLVPLSFLSMTAAFFINMIYWRDRISVAFWRVDAVLTILAGISFLLMSIIGFAVFTAPNA